MNTQDEETPEEKQKILEKSKEFKKSLLQQMFV